MKRIIKITIFVVTIFSFGLHTANSQDALNLELLRAATDGNVDNARSLLSKGADINTQNSAGWTPLHTAIWNNRLRIFELLIEEKADINKTNTKNETPLYFAAEKGNKTIVDILVKNGAEINIVSNENQNALTIARENRYNDIAEYLIKNGATEPVTEEAEGNESETDDQVEQQNNDRRGRRPGFESPRGMQSEQEVNLLADPNEIIERVKTFEGLENAIEEVDSNSISEVRKWKQVKNDNRTSLLRSIEKQYQNETEFIKKTAEEEKAEKTKAAIDEMLASRTERFSEVNRELILQRREQRENEQDTQNSRSRGRNQATGGRGQTSSRDRRRGAQRGRDAGTDIAAAPAGRGPVETMDRRGAQESPEDLLDIEIQEEIDLWLDSDIDDKETLAESVYEMILTEYGAVREVAVGEDAKKTTAAIDGLLLARQNRLDTIIIEITQEREDLARLEARNQGDDSRGRSRRGRGTTQAGGRSSQQNQTRGRVRRR
jgi:hypothetical protein